VSINKITWTAVGADYGDEQINPDTCRGRCIAPTADLSAFGGFLTILIILLMRIIASLLMKSVQGADYR
jgi:hypothetical protein